MTQVDNKRIAKNTLYMYVRMLITLVVSLFTTRITFQALGIDNFGIYNVVGSVIVFFTFINQGLTTATRRYITAELAQGDENSQRNVFNLAVWAHILIALIIIVLGETLGLWAVNSLLNIPSDRLFAANVVYQLSILTAVLNVMQAPYTAVITANERMNIYAYIAIFDVFAKLAVAYGVLYLAGDKLIIYATLLSISSIIVILINRVYCHHCFPMCHYKKPYNRKLLKEMFVYMGWNLTGQGAVVLTNQGVTVLVNMFFTVAANAAMGVSNHITNIVNNFVTSFQVAFNPQITKLYVSKDFKELNALANRCSRMSGFLVLLFVIPICYQIKNFLFVWLGDYPEFAVEFCIYTLIAILVEAISAPLWMIMSSDSNVKKYQITMSSIYVFTFFASWVGLFLGFPPYSVIIVRIIFFMIMVIARLFLVKEKMDSFSIIGWFRDAPLKTLIVACIPLLCCAFLDLMTIDSHLWELLIKGGISFGATCLAVFFVGLQKSERAFILNKFFKK